jgi:mannose-6-phosphate isomerase
LASCDKFVLDRWRFDRPQAAGGDQRCHLIAILSGQALVAGNPDGKPLSAGGTMLLPAALGPVEIRPLGEVVLLDAYLP